MNRPKKTKTLFKYVDKSGWENETPVVDFEEALRKLKKFRKAGRKSAIIVDARFMQRG